MSLPEYVAEDMAADMLEGVAEIAAFIGKSERRTYHLIERGQLPAFKLGGTWHMRKSSYRRLIARLEAEARHDCV